MTTGAKLRSRFDGSGARLLVVSGVVTASVFGARPLISYRALDLGASVVELGLIAASYAAIALAASIPVGRAVDRFGQQRVIASGALTAALGCALALVAPSLVLLALAQAVLGLGQLTMVVGAHSALATRGTSETRDDRIGTFMTVASLGQSIGPFVGGLLADHRTGAGGSTYFVAAAIATAGAAALASRLGYPRATRGTADGRRQASIRRALRKAPMRSALVSSIALLAAVDLLIAYLPLIGEERGIPPATIGLLLGTLGVAQMVSRLFIGPILRIVGHVRLLILAGIVPAILIPLLVLAFPPLLPAFITVAVVAIIGLFLGLGQPVTVTLVALSAEPGGSGLAMGMRMAANRLGQTLIPIAAAGAAGRAGGNGILVTIGVVLVGAVAYVGWQSRGGQPIPAGSIE